MSLFQDLIDASSSADTLSDFIEKHIDRIACFSQKIRAEQESELDLFEKFVLLEISHIRQLDFDVSNNKAFLYYLLDYSVRYRSDRTFILLYQIINDNNLVVGSRIEAAKMYLCDVNVNNDFVERFQPICEKIQYAINNEEDNDARPVKTFLNYYSHVLSISPDYARLVRGKYERHVNDYPFLSHENVAYFLSKEHPDVKALDDFIYGSDEGPQFDLSVASQADEALMEDDTDYADQLMQVVAEFQNVRGLAAKLIDSADDGVYSSLGRGTAVLSNEQQLFQYLKSYGNMHEAKMKSALQYLPIDELKNKPLAIYDWGCGQGVASMVFKEYVSNEYALEIERAVLIEPSLIALKRAALHVKHFYGDCPIKTINKDFDSLDANDVKSKSSEIKLHLFSNVLDMNTFSLPALTELIKLSQSGENYFVCVSPYITDARTNQLDRFVAAFRNEHGFECYCSIDNRAGKWENNWSRVLRLFRVDILP